MDGWISNYWNKKVNDNGARKPIKLAKKMSKLDAFSLVTSWVLVLMLLSITIAYITNIKSKFYLIVSLGNVIFLGLRAIILTGKIMNWYDPNTGTVLNIILTIIITTFYIYITHHYFGVKAFKEKQEQLKNEQRIYGKDQD